MAQAQTWGRRLTLAVLVAVGVPALSVPAIAQNAPATTPAQDSQTGAPPAPPPPEVSPLPPPPPPPSPPPAELPPPPAPPPGPPPFDPKAFSAGAWIRLGGRVQNPTEPDKLDDFYMDQLYMIVSSRGQMTDWLKWQINLNALVPATGSTTPYASVGIQDLIVKIEPHPLLNLWVGRMLVPVDRDNLSGPWFLNYYTYTGFLGNRAGPPIGPKSGPNGRDNGVNLWGQIAGGQAKYYLGAYNLDSRTSTTKPMFTARLNLDLLDPEPGYYHQSAYHGDKDIIAIGGGIQYQGDGSVRTIPPAMPGGMPTSDVGNLTIGTVDLLVDKKLGEAGVGTFEAAVYFLDERQPVRKFYDIGVGYVLPEPVGPGRIAPAVRYQFTQDPNYKQIDGYIQYLVKSHFAKFFLGFIYADLDGIKSKAIQAGIQLIKM
jgi:hypothetical protein